MATKAKAKTKPAKRRARTTVPLTELYTVLYERLVKLAEAEEMEDPGPDYPSRRTENIYLLAFRRGTVRQVCELIAWAECSDPKTIERASKKYIEDYLGKPGIFKTGIK